VTFDFSVALSKIRSGRLVMRAAWAGSGLTLGVVAPPDGESNVMPFVAVRSPEGMLMPWQPSQQEMFAGDWIEVAQEGVGHG
jgi:hypothetical protein